MPALNLGAGICQLLYTELIYVPAFRNNRQFSIYVRQVATIINKDVHHVCLHPNEVRNYMFAPILNAGIYARAVSKYGLACTLKQKYIWYLHYSHCH